MRGWWTELSLTVRLIIGAVAALAVILAIWWAYSALTAKPKAEARLGKNTTEATLQSGQDAVKTVGQVGKNDQAEDDLTRNNADDISHAKGADAPVDPAARDAGLRSLCKRAAYHLDPKCVQHTATP